MPIYRESPRSVVTTTGSSKNSIPGIPKLNNASCAAGEACFKNGTHRKLRRMNGIVRHWKHTSLARKNSSHSLKQKSKRKQRRAVKIDTKKNKSKEFDPEESVLSMSSNKPTEEDESDEELPWYEQDYEEMDWWDYPDLDEEDEITQLVRKIARQQDLAYIERVESLVWTAATKLKNVTTFVLAQRVLQLQKTKPMSPTTALRRISATRRRSSTNANGLPHARVTIPSMFMGLPKANQAEKRRFKKSQEAKKKKNEDEEETNAVKAAVVSPKPVARAAEGTPAPKKVIKRVVVRTKPSKLDYETPAVWNRTTSAPKPKPTVPTTTAVTAATASKTKTSVPKRRGSATPIIAPTPVPAIAPRRKTPTRTASGRTKQTPPPKQDPVVAQRAERRSSLQRIREMKLAQEVLKDESQKQEEQKTDMTVAQQRIETQRKRLEKLRLKKEQAGK